MKGFLFVVARFRLFLVLTMMIMAEEESKERQRARSTKWGLLDLVAGLVGLKAAVFGFWG